MEANCINLTERILQLTLEIIYLLTGEEDIVVKKTSGDGQNSIMVPLRSLVIPENNNEQKILEVTQKMIGLLTGEIRNWSHFNVRMKEEIKEEKKEWDYLEGHKDLYKDVKLENQPPLTSPDGSSNRNPPERCPRPLYSRDSTQEHQAIPQEDQVDGSRYRNPPERYPHPLYSQNSTQEHQEIPQKDHVDGSSYRNPPERCPHPLYSHNSTQEHQEIPQEDQADGSSYRNPPERCPHPLYSWDSTQEHYTIPHHHQGVKVIDIKTEVKEEESMYMRGNQMSVNKAQTVWTITKEEPSLDIDTGGHNGWNTQEERLILSSDHTKDHNGMAQYSPGVSIATQNIHHKLNPMVRATDQIHSEEFKDQSHTIIPNVQPKFPSSDRTSDPSNPEEFSTNNLHPFQDCEKSLTNKLDLVVPQRIYTSEKRFSCSECQISFTKKSHFVQHQRIHTGEKPFSCSQCGKSFTVKSTLTRHQRVHTGEKPYSCSECGRRFSDKRNCNRHIRSHFPVQNETNDICRN